jgi:hypothetical protein
MNANLIKSIENAIEALRKMHDECHGYVEIQTNARGGLKYLNEQLNTLNTPTHTVSPPLLDHLIARLNIVEDRLRQFETDAETFRGKLDAEFAIIHKKLAGQF